MMRDDDVEYHGKDAGDGKGDGDEMSSLNDVMRKLEGLVAMGYDRLGSDRRVARRRRVVRRFQRAMSTSTSTSAPAATGSMVAAKAASRATTTMTTMRHNDEDDISSLEWHASLLIYWQLSNQMRARHPTWRDDIYRRHGDGDESRHHCSFLPRRRNRDDVVDRQTDINDDDVDMQHPGIIGGVNNGGKDRNYDAITPSQIEELRIMLDYAIWAYESNEQSLRSLLLSSSSLSLSSTSFSSGIPNVSGANSCPSFRKAHGGRASDGSDRSSDEDEFNARDGVRDSDDVRQTNMAGGYHLIVHQTTEFVDDDYDDNFKPNKRSMRRRKRKPPGRVGYYVAVSHVERTVLIGMKGTSTFEDLLTDCCGRAVRVDLDGDPHRGGDGGNDLNRTPSSYVGDVVGDCVADDDVEHVENGDGGGGYDAAANYEGCVEINCDNEGLADVIRVSAADIEYDGDICPGNSVEVELAIDGGLKYFRRHQQGGGLSNDPNAAAFSDFGGIDACDPAMPGCMPPSDNVLLFPSSSVPPFSRDRVTSQQISPVMERSHTNEYMENHGIETEANRSHKLRGVHEGILHCARVLLREISPLIEEYAVTGGYDVICTGHSLGAGVAILLAVLLRGTYPTLASARSPPSNNEGDGGRRRVRAFAFAPPPIFDRESSLACRHYVTSIVNNSDIIPRSSMTNLDAFLTILEAVRCRLLDGGTNLPGQLNSIASIIALFRKLCEGVEGEMVLTPTDLRMLWDEAASEASLGDGENDKFYWDEEFGHHLFVPGRLLLMYESWSSTPQTADGAAKDGMTSLDGAIARKAPLCFCLPTMNDVQELNEKRRSPAKNGSNESITDSTAEMPALHAIWTDGTILALRGFEIGAGSGMVTDHLTSSYQQSLNSLRRKNSFSVAST
jgi:hypothetical protein